MWEHWKIFQKELILDRLYDVKYHWYEVHEQAKLIYSNKSPNNGTSMEWDGYGLKRGKRELSEEREIFSVLI